jgi:hypothetical protein
MTLQRLTCDGLVESDDAGADGQQKGQGGQMRLLSDTRLDGFVARGNR